MDRQESNERRLTLSLSSAYQNRNVIELRAGCVESVDAPGEDQTGHFVGVIGVLALRPLCQEVLAPFRSIPLDTLYDVDDRIVPAAVKEHSQRVSVFLPVVDTVGCFDVTPTLRFVRVRPLCDLQLPVHDTVYLRTLRHLVVSDVVVPGVFAHDPVEVLYRDLWLLCFWVRL